MNLHPSPTHGIEAQVIRVIERHRFLAGGHELLRAFDELGVFHVIVNDLARHGMPEHLVGVFDAFAQVALVHAVFNDELCEVVAGGGHMVVRAALAQVHLEHLVRAVAIVALNVKIREAREMNLLEEVLNELLQLGIGLRDNGARIAKRGGRVLLEALATEADKLHLAVAVAVRGEHVHVAIFADDHVLQQHFVGVARTENKAQNMRRLRGVLRGVHLLHVVKRVLPIRGAHGRLHDDGVFETDFLLGKVGLGHALLPLAGAHHKRFGIRNAVFVAHLVEAQLAFELVAQVGLNVERDAVFGQIVLNFRNDLRIYVSATPHQMHFVGVLRGKFLHLRQHHFGLVHMLVVEALHDAAMHGVARGEATKRVALHAIFLMDGARDAVAIHIAADKNGNEVGFFGCHKCSSFKRWFAESLCDYTPH